MDKKVRKIYPTKDIVLAYVTTVNPDSYTVDGQLEKSVIALRKVHYRNKVALIPVDTYFPYYSVEKTVPIINKMKKVSSIITTSEIDKIVESEKKNQKINTAEPKKEEIHFTEKDSQKIEKISNELAIDKVKTLTI